MTVLLDANVLLRLAQRGHPHFPLAHKALTTLIHQGHTPAIVPQSIYEYWVVATRPVDRNGLDLPPRVAAAEVLLIRRVCQFFPETPTVFTEWERLVSNHDVKGKPAHDARYVAAMNVHDIDAILTFNVSDFARFDRITVLDPSAMTV